MVPTIHDILSKASVVEPRLGKHWRDARYAHFDWALLSIHELVESLYSVVRGEPQDCSAKEFAVVGEPWHPRWSSRFDEGLWQRHLLQDGLHRSRRRPHLTHCLLAQASDMVPRPFRIVTQLLEIQTVRLGESAQTQPKRRASMLIDLMFLLTTMP